ncbi:MULTISPECIES: potassium channel family protein [Brachybacterium]|uniref:Potassium transporter n=1 Tax=Brachybacterium alimentarium TaxID=47845 RepID=A0A2A3YLZ5_9MICO|nr:MULTISPECIES: TrkA family potassium uptake protein [Brachybacterium]PCC35957.1 potassium transporter [Brachybacterium alimentarium]PCC40311.1 potassium transporter [Brachybacterium alimentarium]RCS63737.1 TrkA family potassium uptake protein [Brachybacterium sp. JB7]RCS67683.1 TrkA family potassium uptake protein [Brachybacterium alimentarium]RCS68064.1 TrkA family potassium uptake protein [Brachybacterium alimentarium]
MARRARDEGVLVIGLGRFGASIALTLEKLGTQVLAIDSQEELVQKYSGQLTHVVRADATEPEVLDQIGAADFSLAVVGVGTSIESSVLIAANLVDLDKPVIWAKAISAAHGRILQRIGCHHVVYPEADAGKRVAHLLNGRLMDFIEFDDGFAIVKMRPPREVQGMTLAESDIRAKFGVTVVGVKSPGKDFTYAVPETMVSSHDLVIVSGHTHLIEKFSNRS